MVWPSAAARSRSATRRATALGVTLALTATAGCTSRPAPPTAASPAPGDCRVRYVARTQPFGLTVDLAVTHTGAGLRTWTVTYDLPAGQQLSRGWNATWSQSGTLVTAVGDGSLAKGGSVTIGLNATGTGAGTGAGAGSTGPEAPDRVALNGVPCTVTVDRQAGPVAAPGPGTAPRLRVTGNRLVDDAGNEVTLVGVNRSGGEYMCVHGGGFWDGPVDDAAIAAIASWRVRAVRIPLNEDCWLATNQVPERYSGARYRQAVTSFVATLKAHGIVPVLDLQWTSGRWTGTASQCRDSHALCQKPMPDAAHAPAFWGSVADTFRADPVPVFDLFNEPYPSDLGVMSRARSWECWLHGGAACPGLSYPAAGMQSLVDAVRGAGATNLILVAGNSYAADLTGWLDHRPTDPTGNLGASWHSYDRNSCNDAGCWDRQVGPVAARVPVVALEIGEHDCAGGYVTSLMPWLDTHTAGYLAWTWNTWDCADGPALITDYAGTPTPFGAAVRQYLLTR
ncbi:cellulase family glycosylhydrolase [Planosporangium sp. 12N6]|uniref:cellulase family glycosylhydrolase n=1 Tax=Planosporangium spinosum TaxID=3402278 RepID=UPI003CF3354E